MTMKTTCGNAPETIQLSQMPAFADNGRDNLLLQMVRYMKTLFESRLGVRSTLVVPAVTDLASFFGCSPLDVLDAFYELRRQGYAYEMDDLYRPVVFEDLMSARAVQSNTGGKAFSSLAKFSDLLRQKFA